jgi:predicted phosphate transport protein (TIGR00153 family)
MLRLIPRDERFVQLFIEDGENLLEAARSLEAMVGAFDRLEERVATIQALEKRGDELDAEINTRLERSFVTPFDREDIHELAVRMDDIIDNIQATAETFVIYDIKAPTPEVQRLSGILSAAANELVEALRRLELGRGSAPHLAMIHELEHEADGLSRAAIGRLFRDRLDPLDVIKLRDVYHSLEEAIDATEDAGEVIERILAKGA